MMSSERGKFYVAIMCLVIAWSVPTRDALAQSEDDLARAGCPRQIAKHARVGYGKGYVVYYVGGGAKSPKGEPRYCEEGTFGVDYKPIIPGFRNTVALGWWHGRRWQGGTGQYEPNTLVTPFPNYSQR
jgi:hypothetical protein